MARCAGGSGLTRRVRQLRGSVLLHHAAKGTALFACFPGRPRNVAFVSSQHLRDIFPLKALDGFFARRPERAEWDARGGPGKRNVAAVDLRAARKYNGALNHVYQFADVSRPVV